jgi:riboflavin kinase
LPYVDDNVERLLLWRDPKQSGAVFGTATLGYLILEWSNWSLLSLVAYVLLLAVAVTFLWNNLASFTNRPGVPVPRWLKEGVSDADVKKHADQATTLINKALGFTYRLATGKEVVLSMQVAFVLYAVGKLGGWFTTLGLFYTVVVLAFTVPKVYELKKDEIDAVAKQVHDVGKDLYVKHLEPYVNKIPRATTAKVPVEPAGPAVGKKLQ